MAGKALLDGLGVFGEFSVALDLADGFSLPPTPTQFLLPEFLLKLQELRLGSVRPHELPAHSIISVALLRPFNICWEAVILMITNSSFVSLPVAKLAPPGQLLLKDLPAKPGHVWKVWIVWNLVIPMPIPSDFTVRSWILDNSLEVTDWVTRPAALSNQAGVSDDFKLLAVLV